jgi:hypothetical protein
MFVFGNGTLGILTMAQAMLAAVWLWVSLLHVQKIRDDHSRRILEAADRAVAEANAAAEEAGLGNDLPDAGGGGGKGGGGGGGGEGGGGEGGGGGEEEEGGGGEEGADAHVPECGGGGGGEDDAVAVAAAAAAARKKAAKQNWRKAAISIAKELNLGNMSKAFSINWRKECRFPKFQGQGLPSFHDYSPLKSVVGHQYAEYVHSGTYGAIFRATLKYGDQPVAIKIEINPNAGLQFEGQVLRAMWMKPEARKHTVRYYGACGFSSDGTIKAEHQIKLWGLKDGQVYSIQGVGLIMEYCKNGSVEKCIHEKGNPISASNKFTLVQRIAEGMEYLHGLGFLHKDLKPANILTVVDFKGEIHPKIMDYGGGIAAGAPLEWPPGTDGYIAPEVQEWREAYRCSRTSIKTRRLSTENSSTKFDVFSFGEIFFFFFCFFSVFSTYSGTHVLWSRFFFFF